LSATTATPEQAFDLLAQAAQVRYPHPDRDNRGLCPAHSDQHNPALVFKIGDTGNLVAYCHSQHCSIEQLANAIGVSTSAFFAGGGTFTTSVKVDWQHKPVLDLLKLMPMEYDHDTLVECVFRTLDHDLDYATRPITSLYKTELLMLGGIWLEPGYRHETHGDWWDIYHVWLGQMHQLDRETRTDPDAMVSAIPRGSL
jgi:hypothetical protein